MQTDSQDQFDEAEGDQAGGNIIPGDHASVLQVPHLVLNAGAGVLVYDKPFLVNDPTRVLQEIRNCERSFDEIWLLLLLEDAPAASQVDDDLPFRGVLNCREMAGTVGERA
eukprot:6192708-Pleurochrysis_carterae.AAC.6